jgi:hypothetical protein
MRSWPGPGRQRCKCVVPTNGVAEELQEHGRQQYEKARLRLEAENLRLPPGSPR